MPAYEYKCPNCGCFEVEQRITEDPLAVCPTCGAAVKRLMPHRVFIAFKGPGFHVNDYPSHGHTASTGGEEKSPAAAGAGGVKPGAGDKSRDARDKSKDAKDDPTGKAASKPVATGF